MDQTNRTLYHIAMDVKIEERMEKNDNYVVESYKEARETLKRTFELTNIWDMPIADIVEKLSVNPQKAKEIYRV